MTSSLFGGFLRVRQNVDGPVQRVEDRECRRKQLPRDLIHASRLSFTVDGVGAGLRRLQATGRRRAAPSCRPRRPVVTDVYLRKRRQLNFNSDTRTVKEQCPRNVHTSRQNPRW